MAYRSGRRVWVVLSRLNALNFAVRQRDSGRQAGTRPRSRIFLSVVVLLGSMTSFAGPPFRTDDPNQFPWRHYEAYVFGIVDRNSGVSSWPLPAFELNVGAAPNLQLHVLIPGAFVTSAGSYGIGDIEPEAKYRFVQETGKRPEVGVLTLHPTI
jgi:hypothetical protein